MTEIILEEVHDEVTGKYMGKIVVDSDIFDKTIKELHPNSDKFTPTEKAMKWKKYLENDVKGADKAGYKKYKKVLKEHGIEL